MTTHRIALANIRPATDPEDSVRMVVEAMRQASGKADVICFPECYVPGYRIGSTDDPADPEWLRTAWATIDAEAARSNLCVVLGTERMEENRLLITARVTLADGRCAGFQDKVQLDPSEDEVYSPGSTRKLFRLGDLTFGVVICHEGWRYPETVRWAARNGAQLVFHPHFELVEDEEFQPAGFADPENTFHEKAALCRAAENTCYFATVNCALRGATTTSALINPDGVLMMHQPYGTEGILLGEIDAEKATRFLASRLRPEHSGQN